MNFLKSILETALYAQLDAQITAYNEANKDKPIKIANLGDGEYVGTAKYTALETEANSYKAQLEGLATEITALKDKKTIDPDTKTALDALKSKYDTDTAELTAQLAKSKFDGAFNSALVGCKAKNPKAVAALFDMEKIKLENDALTGFDDQIATIRKENDYLFEDSGAWGARHGSSKPDVTGVEAAFASLNPGLSID